MPSVSKDILTSVLSIKIKNSFYWYLLLVVSAIITCLKHVMEINWYRELNYLRRMKKYHELSRAYFTRRRGICRVKFCERHAPHRGKGKTEGRGGTRFLYGKEVKILHVRLRCCYLQWHLSWIFQNILQVLSWVLHHSPNGFKALDKFNSFVERTYRSRVNVQRMLNRSRATQIVYTW